MVLSLTMPYSDAYNTDLEEFNQNTIGSNYLNLLTLLTTHYSLLSKLLSTL